MLFRNGECAKECSSTSVKFTYNGNHMGTTRDTKWTSDGKLLILMIIYEFILFSLCSSNKSKFFLFLFMILLVFFFFGAVYYNALSMVLNVISNGCWGTTSTNGYNLSIGHLTIRSYNMTVCELIVKMVSIVLWCYHLVWDMDGG